MSDLASVGSARTYGGVQYKTLFLWALVSASALPVTLCVIKFHITSPQVFLATLMFSTVAAMNSSHTWITLAYFFDRKWLARFAERPVIFFVAPAAIALFTVGAMLFSPAPLAIVLVLCGLFAATWHHAKQNWGIMSIVGKIRGQNVSALRLPLVNSWIFFALAWSIPMSDYAGKISSALLYQISMALLVAYVLYCGWSLKQSGLLFAKDPVTLVFSVLLLGYFVPAVVFQGKPYALIVFGFAHSLQYYILVLSSLALRERRVSVPSKLMLGIALFAALIAGLTIVGYFVIALITDNASVMWDSDAVRAAVGANLAISLIHFWIDAFIWKLSDKSIREAHGDALAF
jgi:hypothetical protein